MTTNVTCFYHSTLWIWNFWELLYLVGNTDNSLMHIDMKFKINHCFCSTQIWFLSRGKRCWLLSMYSDMDMSKGWYQNGNTSSKIWHDTECQNVIILQCCSNGENVFSLQKSILNIICGPYHERDINAIWHCYNLAWKIAVNWRLVWKSCRQILALAWRIAHCQRCSNCLLYPSIKWNDMHLCWCRCLTATNEEGTKHKRKFWWLRIPSEPLFIYSLWMRNLHIIFLLLWL